MKQFGMKKIEAFILEKARIGVHRTIEENNEWVREMAKK